MKNKPTLSIVIVNFNTAKLTLQCIESIETYCENISYEIILIDNASNSEDLKTLKIGLKGKKHLLLIENSSNAGFAKANNIGMTKSKGNYLLLLNSDTILNSKVSSNIVKWLENNPKVGIASCQLYNTDGSVQGTGGYFPSLFKLFSWMLMIDDIPGISNLIKPFHPVHKKGLYKGILPSKPTQLDWLTGAFFLIRREVYDQIGGMDEDYFMYVEDVDYCYRAKKRDWQVWLLPQYGITHLGGSSSTKSYPLISEFQNLLLFYQKHYPAWQKQVARVLFKAGSMLRVFVFGILEGREAASIYVQTFKQL